MSIRRGPRIVPAIKCRRLFRHRRRGGLAGGRFQYRQGPREHAAGSDFQPAVADAAVDTATRGDPQQAGDRQLAVETAGDLCLLDPRRAALAAAGGNLEGAGDDQRLDDALDDQ